MSKIKKITICASAFVILLIAFVVGFIGNADNNRLAKQGSIESYRPVKQNRVETTKNSIAINYTYQPGHYTMTKGDDVINYSYVPSANAKDGETPITTVYEYVFKGVMKDTCAVNLKAINAEGVTIRYAYADEKIEDTDTITGEAYFTTQELSKDEKIYIYILVTPISGKLEAQFTDSVVFYFGKTANITVTNASGQSVKQTIVKGQQINEHNVRPPVLTQQEINEGKSFAGWYLDADFSVPATFPISPSQKLYARYSNLPVDYLAWDDTEKCYYVKNYSYNGSVGVPTDLIIPSSYNDGAHGVANIEYIESSNSDGKEAPSSKFTNVQTIFIPKTIKKIGNRAFVWNYLLTNVTFEKDSQLEIIDEGAFEGCSALVSINLKGLTNLITIGDNAFNGIILLTDFDLSGCIRLTTLGSSLITGDIKSINLSGCISLVNTSSSTLAALYIVEIVDLTNIPTINAAICDMVNSVAVPELTLKLSQGATIEGGIRFENIIYV